MPDKNVIDSKYLPVRLPVWPTITMALLLDRVHANGITYGIVGTLFAIMWVAAIDLVIKQKKVHPSDLPKSDNQ